MCRCGKPRPNGGRFGFSSLCVKHFRNWLDHKAKRERAYSRRRAATLAAAGQCRCGKPLEPGRKACKACLKAHALVERRRYRRRNGNLGGVL
jgi:hypothetical protein